MTACKQNLTRVTQTTIEVSPSYLSKSNSGHSLVAIDKLPLYTGSL